MLMKFMTKIKNLIFVDSSFWIASAVKTDHFHKQAIELLTIPFQENNLFSTSDFVLDETLTRLKRKVGARAANKFYQLVQNKEKKRQLYVYRLTKTLFHKAYVIFNEHPTLKSFSFTDATIIAIMKKYNIDTLLTFDADFRKVGIKILPY